MTLAETGWSFVAPEVVGLIPFPAARAGAIESETLTTPTILGGNFSPIVSGEVMGGGRAVNLGERFFSATPPNVMARGWRVGDPINYLTGSGRVPIWRSVARRAWKNEAFYNAGKYDPVNVARMARGDPPQRFNLQTGLLESKEWHHWPPQRDGGLFDIRALWADEHAAQDVFRHIGGN